VSIIETPDFSAMDIAQLRAYASHTRVAVAKTATKKEIIESITRKLNGRVVPEIASEVSQVKPGYAKIKLMNDPMPGASNLPVYLMCNGYQCLIPRDVPVIVPMRVVRTLNDAVATVKKQSLVSDNGGREVFKEVDVKSLSYPFQILEMTPGPEVLTSLEASKLKTVGPRKRYRDLFGHWPKSRELTRAIEQKLISLDDDEHLSESESKLLGTEELIG
jgi:hypothetical protein